MKIDAKRVREARQRRAWSQEHLAEVSGLSLRTIQRIESAGAASHESIASLSSVLNIPVEELLVDEAGSGGLVEKLEAKRFAVMFVLFLAGSVVSPPTLTNALATAAGLWLVFEVSLALVRAKRLEARANLNRTKSL